MVMPDAAEVHQRGQGLRLDWLMEGVTHHRGEGVELRPGPGVAVCGAHGG